MVLRFITVFKLGSNVWAIIGENNAILLRDGASVFLVSDWMMKTNNSFHILFPHSPFWFSWIKEAYTELFGALASLNYISNVASTLLCLAFLKRFRGGAKFPWAFLETYWFFIRVDSVLIGIPFSLAILALAKTNCQLYQKLGTLYQ